VVLPLLLGGKFVDSASVLQHFSPIFVLFAVNNAVSVYVLLPMRLDRWVSAVGVASACLNVGLMFLVAGEHGANGIATCRVVVEFAVLLMLVSVWRRRASSGQVL
jgi:O-antigen/teichoic acid export membrane protein